ncbi:MAG: immunity 26/phosphotriesterase HocA family protein [Ruminococcus sp.]|jgi:hypothetical protein|nr:immunity 26/phosphotriesterase HocA family protein [Ruminococcus sp.]
MDRSIDFGRKDLVYDAWEERRNSLPLKLRKKLDSINYNTVELIKIKAKRPKHICTGDLFVLSPRENLYFYGHVLDGEIKTVDKRGAAEGNNLVVIYRLNTDEINAERFIEAYKPDFLFEPTIVDKRCWTHGMFYNIGNFDFDYNDPKYDFGFLDLMSGIVNEKGEFLDHIPKWLDYRGITSHAGIAARLERELEIDPALLRLVEI